MRRTPSWARCARVLVAIGTLSMLGCGGGKEKKAEPSELEKLGVDTHEVARTDAQTLQPLQSRHTVFQKRSELYLSGVYTTDAALFTGPYLHKRQVLLDDARSASGTTPAYAPLFTDTSYEGWTTSDSVSTAADLDGDGVDEVVVLYRKTDVTPAKAFLRVIRHGTSAYEQSDAYELSGTFALDYVLPTFNDLQLASGDVDGDGSAELAAAIGNRLLILKWVPSEFRLLAEKTYRPGVARQLTTVAVGNVDTDPQVEIVVVNGLYAANSAYYYVYSYADGHLTTEAGDATLSEAQTADGGPLNYGYAAIAIGDLNGDHVNEIVFAGDVFANLLSVTVMRYSPTEHAFQRTTTGRYGIDWNWQWMPFVAVIDADGLEGGRAKELVAYRYILYLDGSGKLAHKWANPALTTPYYDKMTVGDFTGDGREDVALVSWDQWLIIYSYTDGAFREVKRIDIDADGRHTALCAANVDQDSTVLEYTGEYALLYSEPKVIAVLASPPYYAGQDTFGATTELTLEATTEDQSGQTLGFYAGVSVGYSAETPFWGSAGSSKLAFTVDTSMDWNFTTGSSFIASTTFQAAAGENKVVFASTPSDVYYYEVVVSPDKTQVGSRVSVEIPRQPEVIQVPLEMYNGIVAEEFRVPAEVASHTFGDPRSYPTRSDMEGLFSGGEGNPDGSYSDVIPFSPHGGFRTPDPFRINVGWGAAARNISLTQGASKGYGSEFNLQVGLEFENVSGGVLVGGKAGFHYGSSHSFTTSENTTISGWVPDIPTAMSTKEPYTVGLFAYPYPPAGNSTYVVVTYWVE